MGESPQGPVLTPAVVNHGKRFHDRLGARARRRGDAAFSMAAIDLILGANRPSNSAASPSDDTTRTSESSDAWPLPSRFRTVPTATPARAANSSYRRFCARRWARRLPPSNVAISWGVARSRLGMTYLRIWPGRLPAGWRHARNKSSLNHNILIFNH